MASFSGGPNGDTFDGGADNDTASGNGGNDTLNGNNGADLLGGGTGDDLLLSAVPLGDDTANPVLDAGNQADTLNGGDGNDTLSAGFGDSVDGGEGYDNLYLSFQGASAGVTFDMTLTSQVVGGAMIQNVESAARIDGSNFGDTLTDAGSPYGTFGRVYGMGGNDILKAGYYTWILSGGDGNDLVDGRGSQYLYRVEGGAGNDTLYNDGISQIDGGDGDDLMYAHGQVNGGAGNDTIQMIYTYYFGAAYGDEGNDSITAAEGLSSSLLGNDGNDTLTGSGGTDMLTGGAGNDRLTGGGEYPPGTTGDIAVYSGASSDYQVVRDAEAHLVIVVDLRPDSPDGADTLDDIEALTFSNATYLIDVLLESTGLGGLNFTGGTGNDVFAGSEAGNTATGKGGDDTLGGNGGEDFLQGDGGADVLNGGTGYDSLFATGSLGDYQAPYLNDSYVAPELDRGLEVDTLNGGDGGDVLSAGYGDNVDGGDGSDSLYISFQGASAGVTFSSGLTQVIGGGTIQNVEGAAWIEGSEYADTISDSGYSYGGFAAAFGMGGDDSLVAGYYTGSLFGNDGNDFLDGRNSQYLQVLSGGDGNDTLYCSGNSFGNAHGGDGDDLVYAYRLTYGGAGNDTILLQGGYSSDAMYGGDGNDDIQASQWSGASFFGDAGADTLTGNNSDDVLSGGAGNDVLTGGDNLSGTTGDTAVFSGVSGDYLFVENSETGFITVTDLRPDAPDGVDTIDRTIEALQFSNGVFLLDVILSGGSLVTDFVGGDGDDTFIGSEANNTAQGRTGNDTFRGNGGNDSLQGDAGADLLNGGSGFDWLYSAGASGSYRVPDYNFSAITPELDRVTDVDSLSGGAGADFLSAGYGDNVDGGDGEDYLFISFQGATSGVTFNMNLSSQVVGGGTIQNVEGATWLEGSDFDDAITDGGSAYNAYSAVFGMAGNDTLVGSYFTAGMSGGNGDDRIDVTNSSYLSKVYGDVGNDTIYASQAFVDGGDGDDLLVARGQVSAGAGNDTVSLDYDFVGYWGAQAVHGDDGNDLIDGGGQARSSLFGDAGNDTLRGTNGDDLLTGGAGNDNLTGNLSSYTGSGDVAVYSGSSTDYQISWDAGTQTATIVDLRPDSPDGTDTLQGVEALQFANGTFLIEVVLAGGGLVLNFAGEDSDDIFAGSEAANTAVGKAGDDTFSGNGGNDTLQGDAGADVLNGGTGDDYLYASEPLGGYSLPYTETYQSPLLDRGSDVDGMSGGAGNDTISAGYGDYVDGGDGTDSLFISFLGASAGVTFDMTLTSQMVGGSVIQNVENASWIEGSNYDDAITDYGYGTSGVIFGMGGNDSLVAGYGTYALFGGDGNDVVDARNAYYLWRAEGGTGDDTIYSRGQVSGGAGNDTVVVSYSFYGVMSIHGDEGNDVIDGSQQWGSLLFGDSGNDLIIGNNGNDTLEGGTGVDTVSYAGAYGAVMVSLTSGEANGAGWDSLSGFEKVIGSIYSDNLVGDTGKNTLNGAGGSDMLDGGAGGDRLLGGLGDDTYYIDDVTDSVGENHLEGTDTIISSVSYSLWGRAVEILTLTGTGNLTATGNSLDNVITGNVGNNTLDGAAGNDVLDGGAGDDRMLGGLGNDTYYVDNAGDSVGENHLEGTDTIISSVSYSLVGRAVEILTLTGEGNLNATGNSLNNTLNGTGGNNGLDGGTGADTMVGGLGDDTYYVDYAGDRVHELHFEGTDTVFSSVSYSLFGRAVEVMTLTGSAHINATGNSLNNTLTGNSGNNRLDGGVGNDTLAGGLGEDVFVFMSGTWKDTVTDFNAAQNDTIDIHAITNGTANSAMVTQVGTDVVINLGGGNTVTVLGAAQADVLSHIVW
ncbi:rhizobiocin RzcA [Asticcacaulis biprosthecium C19]|uniref:Rhizobiocin RzcA n=1 Tax=Asticcacaulis biprosthecium C19 TaxID=715226 RepID=F4QRB3_9CAUL|nr:rhizobiocin RzcA [Asticcacaulis biprosthecium]EGF90750.1 rhizobiocin RzcA [Asticcacaulis biprosthecium C19]